VIGTTGHSLEEMKLIEEASKELPIFKAANFSIGIAYMKTMLNLIKNPSYIDIIEQHPASKKDTPSGTALELSKEIGCKNIHSIRSHSHVFSHECKIAFEEEEISIKHTAFNRTPFARGAIEAANYLLKMPNGLYSMTDLTR
jgi:4-hydroxy-tetrahydrodipicolinate reductase